MTKLKNYIFSFKSPLSVKIDSLGTKEQGLPPLKSYDPGSGGRVMSLDKLEGFFIFIYKINYQQTWQCGDWN